MGGFFGIGVTQLAGAFYGSTAIRQYGSTAISYYPLLVTRHSSLRYSIGYESGTPPVSRPSLPVSVLGTGARSLGPGTGSAPRTEHRAPGTEPNAPSGYASCLGSLLTLLRGSRLTWGGGRWHRVESIILKHGGLGSPPPGRHRVSWAGYPVPPRAELGTWGEAEMSPAFATRPYLTVGRGVGKMGWVCREGVA